MSYRGYDQSTPSYTQGQNDPWPIYETEAQESFDIPQDQYGLLPQQQQPAPQQAPTSDYTGHWGGVQGHQNVANTGLSPWTAHYGELAQVSGTPNVLGGEGRTFQDLQSLQPDPINYNYGGYPNVPNPPQLLGDQRTYGGYGGYGEMQGPTLGSRQQPSFSDLMPSNRTDIGIQERFPQRTSGRRQQKQFVPGLEYSSANPPGRPWPDRSAVYDPRRPSLRKPSQRLDKSSGFSSKRRSQGSSSQQLAAKNLSSDQSSSDEHSSDSSRRPVKKIRKRHTKISSNHPDQLEYDRLMHSLVEQPRVVTESPQVETVTTESHTRPSSSRRDNQPLTRSRSRYPNPDYRYKTPVGRKEQRDIQQALHISRADYENCTDGVSPPNTSEKECYAFQLSELETSAFIVSEQRGRPMASSLISRGPWHFQIGNWMHSDVLDGLPEHHFDQDRAAAQRQIIAQSQGTAQRRARDQARTRNPSQAAGSLLRAASNPQATDQGKAEDDESQVKEGQYHGTSRQHEAGGLQILAEGAQIRAESDKAQAKGSQTAAEGDETQAEHAQTQAEGLPHQAIDGAAEGSPAVTEGEMHELNATALMALANDAKRKLNNDNEHPVSEHAVAARAREESHDSPLSDLNSDDLQFLD